MFLLMQVSHFCKSFYLIGVLTEDLVMGGVLSSRQDAASVLHEFQLFLEKTKFTRCKLYYI